MPGGNKSTATDLNAISAGTYQRDKDRVADVDWTQDTEVEIATVSDNIVASGSDKYFRWVRIWYQFWDPNNAYTPSMHEYVLLRCKSTDALMDLDSASEFELAQKEGRIMAHGFVQMGNGYTPTKLLVINKYKFKLFDGEELRLIVRPQMTIADCVSECVVQWREIEL